MTHTEPLITGVDFVAVPTDDFDASLPLLRRGARAAMHRALRGAPGAEFQAGNLTLVVMENEGFGQPFSPNSMVIALQVADVEAARSHLQAAGVEFATATFDSGVCHQAIFHDPAGNPLDLHHRYAPPRPRGAAA